MVREICPEYRKFQRLLDEYAVRTGKSEAWTNYDLWRWKRIPKSVIEELGIAANESCPTEKSSLEFRSTSGYSPCVEGLSMEGVFNQRLPMERVANLLNLVGNVTTSPDNSIAEVHSITVFREGPVMIKAPDERTLDAKASQLRQVVMRAVNCAGCGICIGRCQKNALSLDGQIEVDPLKCDHCGKCLGPCPAVKFNYGELDI